MEDMSVSVSARTAEASDSPQGNAPRDLREWLSTVEPMGEILRITEEVDRDEEMGAITYMAYQTIGAPAVLFENIRGCPPGHSALWNMMGSSVDRFAATIGEPPGLSVMDLIKRCKTKFTRQIPPVMVEPRQAPVNANHMLGSDIDITIFPSGRHWPGDGGRYIGTADAVITRDPDDGWLNVGVYRMMVHDRNHVGLYISPGKDARLHIERCWSRNQPCEIVAVWGVDPAMFIGASQGFPKTVSELDFIGGMTGAPVELVPGQTVGLPYPARAEIVMEGILRPNSMKLEGPFGEFTGYYGRPEEPAYNVEVTAVHYRDKPILTHALMADYPANECSLLYSIARSARIWNDLDRLGVPGIRGVYSHPAASGGFFMTIVSLEQRYAGHAPQVLALAAQVPGGALLSKWIIVVDHDVDPSNMNQVLWAMATRCHPADDIDLLRSTWATPLDPAQNPAEKRSYGSKALINACMDHRHIKTFSRRTMLRRSTYKSVAAKWRDLGMPGQPPDLWALED